MFKALLSKQLREVFSSYNVNRKTGKKRSKAGTAAFSALYIFLLFLVGVMFYALAHLLGSALLPSRTAWLYYSIMGIMAILFGTLGTVFSTFHMLYKAKDNDMLLAMPIPSRMLLGSRVSTVFLLALPYTASAWIPAFLYDLINEAPSTAAVLFGILLTFILSLFVTVLSCALGWVVAFISSKIKNKSIVRVTLTILFVGGYQFAAGNIADFMKSIASNGDAVGKSVKQYGNLIYQLGTAATGSISGMLLFTLTVLVLSVLCGLIMVKTFRSAVIAKGSSESVSQKIQFSGKSISRSLLGREWLRFKSSPLYILNCGLGAIFLPVLTVLGIIKGKELFPLIEAFEESYPDIRGLLAAAISVAVCMICSINVVSTPSISLEGKSLWIIRSLPVDGKSVLSAKSRFHCLVNMIPALIAVTVLSVFAGAGPLAILSAIVFVSAFILLTGNLGLIFGLKRHNFSWTNETVPIKQDANVLLVMVCGWAISAAAAALCWFLRKPLGTEAAFSAAAALTVCAAVLTTRFLQTKGSEMFSSL